MVVEEALTRVRVATNLAGEVQRIRGPADALEDAFFPLTWKMADRLWAESKNR